MARAAASAASSSKAISAAQAGTTLACWLTAPDRHGGRIEQLAFTACARRPDARRRRTARLAAGLAPASWRASDEAQCRARGTFYPPPTTTHHHPLGHPFGLFVWNGMRSVPWMWGGDGPLGWAGGCPGRLGLGWVRTVFLTALDGPFDGSAPHWRSSPTWSTCFLHRGQISATLTV